MIRTFLSSDSVEMVKALSPWWAWVEFGPENKMVHCTKISCNAPNHGLDTWRRQTNGRPDGRWKFQFAAILGRFGHGKGSSPMNDTMQKTMATAANEAKAQFESATKMFESMMTNEGAQKAAEQGAENLRAASESVQALMGDMEQITTGFAQHFAKAMTHAFETQAKMLTAGGWQQAAELQYAYLNESMDSSFSEVSRLADRSTAMLTKATQPLQARFDAMTKAA
jgi:hypothetical protein